jgi:hypothetical protein
MRPPARTARVTPLRVDEVVGVGEAKNGGSCGGLKVASGGRCGALKAGDVTGDECQYCGKRCHWARECRKKKKDGQAHATQVDEGESMLLVAVVLEGTHASIAP